jgi:hypothetical protein
MKTKMKTSLTLSREVVRGIDRVAGEKRSRSAVVDDVLRGNLSHRERAAANARDAEKINRFADELNAEMQDVLALPVSRPPLGGAMKRGDLYRLRHPGGGDPRKQRVMTVVSRQALVDSRFPRSFALRRSHVVTDSKRRSP